MINHWQKAGEGDLSIGEAAHFHQISSFPFLYTCIICIDPFHRLIVNLVPMHDLWWKSFLRCIISHLDCKTNGSLLWIAIVNPDVNSRSICMPSLSFENEVNFVINLSVGGIVRSINFRALRRRPSRRFCYFKAINPTFSPSTNRLWI